MSLRRSLFVMALITASTASAGAARGEGGFFDEIFAPSHHTHFSELGTPYVHPFNFEPPQIHQDVFFIYKYTDNTIEGEKEHEAEAHIDWALTKRLGFVLAAPLIGIEDATGTQNVGFGDIEFGPRAMLVEQDKFILASNLFMTIPTGDPSRGLSSGEMVMSPYITTWHDLTYSDNHWNTLLINFGPNVGLESGETTMSYAFSLTHTWQGPVLLEGDHDVEHVHDDGHQHHFPPGMTSIYLEMTGETELGGDERTFVELMPGVSYVLTEHAEIRFGVLLPVSQTQRFDSQYFTSFTWIH